MQQPEKTETQAQRTFESQPTVYCNTCTQGADGVRGETGLCQVCFDGSGYVRRSPEPLTVQEMQALPDDGGEPECDLPCSVEPCDGTDCARDDSEDANNFADDPPSIPDTPAAFFAQPNVSDNVARYPEQPETHVFPGTFTDVQPHADGGGFDYTPAPEQEAAIAPEDFNADEPVPERECAECDENPLQRELDELTEMYIRQGLSIFDLIQEKKRRNPTLHVNIDIKRDDTPFRDELVDHLWRDVYDILDNAVTDGPGGAAKLLDAKRAVARLVELAKGA